MLQYIDEPEFILSTDQIDLFKAFNINSLIKCLNFYVDNYNECPKVYNNYIAIVLPLVVNYSSNDKFNETKDSFSKIFATLPLSIIKQIIDNYTGLYADKTILKAALANPDNMVLEYILMNKNIDYYTNVQMLSHFSLYPEKMQTFYDILFTKHCGKYLFRGNVTQVEHYENKKYYDEMFRINGKLIDKYTNLLNSIGITINYSIPSEPTFCVIYSNICLVKEGYSFDNYLDFSCKESSITDEVIENFKNMSCPQKISTCINEYIKNYYEAPTVYYNYIVAAYYYLMNYQFSKIYNQNSPRNCYLHATLAPFSEITCKIIKNLPPNIVSYCLNVNNLSSAYINLDVIAHIKNSITMEYVLSKYIVKYDSHIKFINDVITKNKWPGRQTKLLSKVYNTLIKVNSGKACIATYYINCSAYPTVNEINYLNSIGINIKHIMLQEPGKKAIIFEKYKNVCLISKNGHSYTITCDLSKKLDKYYSNPELYSVIVNDNVYTVNKNYKEDKISRWISLISYTSTIIVPKLYKTITLVS